MWQFTNRISSVVLSTSLFLPSIILICTLKCILGYSEKRRSWNKLHVIMHLSQNSIREHIAEGPRNKRQKKWSKERKPTPNQKKTTTTRIERIQKMLRKTKIISTKNDKHWRHSNRYQFCQDVLYASFVCVCVWRLHSHHIRCVLSFSPALRSQYFPYFPFLVLISAFFFASTPDAGAHFEIYSSGFIQYLFNKIETGTNSLLFWLLKRTN